MPKLNQTTIVGNVTTHVTWLKSAGVVISCMSKMRTALKMHEMKVASFSYAIPWDHSGLEKLWWYKQKTRSEKKTTAVLKSEMWIRLPALEKLLLHRQTIVTLWLEFIMLTVKQWVEISLQGVSIPKSGAMSIVSDIQTAGLIRCVSVTLYPGASRADSCVSFQPLPHHCCSHWT